MGKIGDGKGEELPFSENFGTHENKICYYDPVPTDLLKDQ